MTSQFHHAVYQDSLKTLDRNEVLDRSRMTTQHDIDNPKEKLPWEFYPMERISKGYEKEKAGGAFEKDPGRPTFSGIRLFKRPRRETNDDFQRPFKLPRPRQRQTGDHVSQAQQQPLPETQQECSKPADREPVPLLDFSVRSSIGSKCGVYAPVNLSIHSACTTPSGDLDIVWQKLQSLKEKYLADMKQLFALLEIRSTMPISPGQLSKVKLYKEVLYRIIPYLTVPVEKLPKQFNKEKAELLEKETVRIMESFKSRRHVNLAQQQSIPAPPLEQEKQQQQPDQAPRPAPDSR